MFVILHYDDHVIAGRDGPKPRRISMSFFKSNFQAKQALRAFDAIKKSQMVVEFGLDGTILDANAKFLDRFGYQLDDVKDKHCNTLKRPEDHDSSDDRQLWASLRSGIAQFNDEARIAKNGTLIWLSATYIPVLDEAGKPARVIQLATCVTDQKTRQLEIAGKSNAVSRVQAMIEFDLEGVILDANENFLRVLGYSLAEIKGKHHSMFVEPSLKNSSE